PGEAQERFFGIALAVFDIHRRPGSRASPGGPSELPSERKRGRCLEPRHDSETSGIAWNKGMNENLSKDFVWRRMLENFGDWAIALPVLLAFVVLGLMVLFRKERRFSGMLVPFVVAIVASAIYVPLALALKPVFSWWVVLTPLMVVALIYVALMYVKDAQSIHPLLAAFLGGLRCAVYAILAFVFLLPGCQTYERTESFS